MIMKTLQRTIPMLVLAGTLIFTAAPPKLQAADYAVQKTFWSFAGTWTNVAGADTNLASAIDLTTFSDFNLQIVAKHTNAAVAGFFSVVWETSADGVNWPTGYTNNAPGAVGWFAIPATNNLTTAWNTNITVGSAGYWRIRHLTNASSGAVTNLSLAGYVKPKRTSSDF